MKKLIGTFIPVSALTSLKNNGQVNGTFAAGIVFIDWLKKTNQSTWQMLPIHETQLEENSSTRHIPSPYKSYGIGLHPQFLPNNYKKKYPTQDEKKLFLEENHYWLFDYVFFCALRDHFQTDDWRKWDEEIRFRDKIAISFWKEKLEKKIDFYLTQQWQLNQSYLDLRSHSKKVGVMLIGDLPFYISLQSPLVWAYQDIFRIEKDGNMSKVSGIPNMNKTYFGRQIWGHPLYKWGTKSQNERIVDLWKLRIRYQAKLFDYVRIDHANGFFEYGCINIKNNKKDMYEKGPGSKIFENLINYCHLLGLKVFVEDSGENILELKQSMHKKNISGVRVLIFAFGGIPNIISKKFAEIFKYPSQTVAYTSTHDTKTLTGFLEVLDTKNKKILAKTANVSYSLDIKPLAIALRNAIIKSPAQIAIIPIQDWLLTTDRINVPGTELSINDPNWHFRLQIPVEELPSISV